MTKYSQTSQFSTTCAIYFIYFVMLNNQKYEHQQQEHCHKTDTMCQQQNNVNILTYYSTKNLEK